MKNFKTLAIILSSFAIGASCDTEENLNGQGPINSADIPTATLEDVPASFTMIEEDETFEVKVTLDKPWRMDSEVYIEMLEGTATAGEDFDISGVRIEDGDTEGIITLEVHGDDIPEETETAKFKISAGPNIKLESSPEFTITLENYVSPDLNVVVSWDADFYEESPASLVDFDVYIRNADGDDVAAAETGNFEHLDLDGTLPDGDYVLYAFLYADFNPGDFGPVEYPITCTFGRLGVFSDLVLTQNPNTVLSTDALDYDNDGEVTVVDLAIITISDGVFTIKTVPEGEEDPIIIGGGRLGAKRFNFDVSKIK